MRDNKKKMLIWFFGRGASIACGLDWPVPGEWKEKGRGEQIQLIKDTLREKMDCINVDTTPYKELLKTLSCRTNPRWNHLFFTTNWDFLLQREIDRLSLSVLPPWLNNSFVFHLNGTIKELPDNSNRSPFLLESDLPNKRTQSFEANKILNSTICNQAFVVLGMSFECPMDQDFLNVLGSVEDVSEVGESEWIIVNTKEAELRRVEDLIRKKMPYSEIKTVHARFEEWVQEGMLQLQERGVLDGHEGYGTL